MDGLPPDSAYHRDGRMWTPDNELAAVCNETLQFWLTASIGMWMAKGAKVPAIVPIKHPDRPTAEPQKPKVLTAREIAARMGMG